MSWLKHHIPTRETIHEYRLLRPFARHLSKPELWRMTRRSVPRAVALGLGVGVTIPFMHMAIAAVLAIPTRANVAIAAVAALLISNPATYGPLYYAAYHIGSWELHHDATLMDPKAAAQVSGELAHFMFWIHHASGAIALGVLTLAASAAVIGYMVSALSWRWWLGSKWRHRRQASRAARA
jgi:hypothetical protein